MFIAQHSARSRMVRTVFLAAGLVPCVALLSWAAWRHSWGHREALRRSLEGALGVRLSIGAVEHLRPGGVRLRGVVVDDGIGGAGIGIPALDADVAPGEVRIRAAAVDSTPAAAALLATLGRAWLEQPMRFDRNVVVEIDAFGVSFADRPAGARGIERWDGGGCGLRVECVATDGGRAIRVRTTPESGDECVVRVLSDGPGRRPAVEVQGRSARPLPIALVAAILDWPSLPATCGAAATVSGGIDARRGADGWEGSIEADLSAVDLSAVTSGLSLRLDGTARVSIPDGRFAAGRLSRGRAVVTAGPGRIARESLTTLVGVVGCRPGNAWRTIDRGADVAFDSMEAVVSVDTDGVTLRGDAAGLLSVGGEALVTAPPGPVGIDRIAQALSPSVPTAVPATPVSAWLLSTFPLPVGARGTPHAVGGAPRPDGPAADGTRR